MKPLKINPEYRKLVPPIGPEEYRALEIDIIANQGCFESIKINKKDEILDGHNRFEICNKYALYFDTDVIDLPSVLDEEIYVIKTNLLRRQLTDFQKVEMAKPLEDRIAEKAKQQMLAGKTLPANAERVHTDIEVSKAIGVTRGTYERAKKVRDEGTEEEKRKAREKKRMVNSAFRDVVIRQKREALIKGSASSFPKGIYNVILADPPWDYYAKLRGTADLHYPTMKDEEISKLKVPYADDAVLFLWATNPKLEDALRVMQAWGFTYRTLMVWSKVKDGKLQMGTGYYVRANVELLLIGIKGSIGPPLEENRPLGLIQAPREEHSKKPSIVYDIIERMYPDYNSYLELFARPKVKRDGWTYWGNEV